MLSDTDQDALEHIRDNIILAQNFVEGLELKDFQNDVKAFYATTRCLEIISEASRRLSADLKSRHSHIPWKAIAGSGSIYRHDYEDVLDHRIFETIREALPQLLDVVMIELKASSQEE
jgi:uncharacterized protein with HEPN domain